MHDANINRDLDKLKVLSYCKIRVTNNRIMQSIERHELQALLDMYSVIAMNDGDNRECYERICKLDIKPIRNNLNNNVRLKIFSIKHARFIYDLILRKRYKNSNGE